MKYKAVLFDLDGTLLNTLDDLADSTNYALRECGYPERTLDEVRSFVGDGIFALVRRSLPEEISSAEVIKCNKIFSAHYDRNLANKTAPYDGVCGVIARLRENGIKIAVVTNKDERDAKMLCKKFFGDSIDVVIGGMAQIPKKPHPAWVEATLKQLGVSKTDAVFVGDSQVDFRTAVYAQIPCICVLWGYRTREQLRELGADCFCESAEALEKMLLE